jgi:hypothetical protein
MIKSRGMLLCLIFSIPLIVILSECNFFRAAAPPQDPRGPQYAGASTCVKCHKNVFSDYLHTAHFSTSQQATESTISGAFSAGANTFVFNKNLKVMMEKRDSGLFQVSYLEGKPIDARRFAITFGGIKAESYLYWRGNALYQLPISYFKNMHSWTNSPGYDSARADFSRPITIGCLECHSSYIKELAEQTHRGQTVTAFDKSSLILGIDCERCHGPSSDHVFYQTNHPEDKRAKYIITYASLSRARKINMCAVCHSGSTGVMLRSTFGFKPDDNLSDYKIEDIFQTTDPNKLDVHGNQSRLLTSSKCFMMSNMDCATCHNIHSNERQQISLYSQKCMSCHSDATHNFCTLAAQIGTIIKTNCIDCHMPAKPSNIIAVKASGRENVIPYLVRSHHITIYPNESQNVLNNFKKNHKLSSN